MFDNWNGEREMSMVLTYDLDLFLMQVALIILSNNPKSISVSFLNISPKSLPISQECLRIQLDNAR